MDLTIVASFVAFFALVLAWLVAPSGITAPVVMAKPSTAGAAD
jgi:hypothetical protein